MAIYEVSTLEKDTKICTVTGSTKKAVFSEILSQDMSFQAVTHQKPRFSLVDQLGQPIRSLAFCRETA